MLNRQTNSRKNIDLTTFRTVCWFYQASFNMKGAVLALMLLIAYVQSTNALTCKDLETPCTNGQKCQLRMENCETQPMCVDPIEYQKCNRKTPNSCGVGEKCVTVFDDSCKSGICKPQHVCLGSTDKPIPCASEPSPCQSPQTCVNVFPESCMMPPCSVTSKCVEIQDCPNVEACIAVQCDSINPDHKCDSDSGCGNGQTCCKACCNLECKAP